MGKNKKRKKINNKNRKTANEDMDITMSAADVDIATSTNGHTTTAADGDWGITMSAADVDIATSTNGHTTTAADVDWDITMSVADVDIATSTNGHKRYLQLIEIYSEVQELWQHANTYISTPTGKAALYWLANISILVLLIPEIKHDNYAIYTFIVSVLAALFAELCLLFVEAESKYGKSFLIGLTSGLFCYSEFLTSYPVSFIISFIITITYRLQNKHIF